jgi:hypothetical protein
MVAKAFRREPSTVIRDAKMVELHAAGWTYDRIAAHLGIANKSTVSRGIQRILNEVRSPAAEELRRVSGERMRRNLERLYDELQRAHPIIRDGARHDDLVDATAIVAILREIRMTDESLRRLHGVDAPTRAEVRVTDDLTAEIEQLAAELAGADRRASDRSKESTPGPAGS